jgi:carbohydrate kinase (thermoresistant glucokinase family)
MGRLLESETPTVAVTCSALRTVYRDELRRLSNLFDFPVTVTFLLLSLQDREQLRHRMVVREDHYMKSAMVDSQLELLENPVDEPDVLVLDASRGREEVLDDVVQTVEGILRA